MDERIIDFNELKNRVNDKDIDKFENYIYSLYYDMAQGKLSMAEMSRKVMEYTNENNISNDKFIKMQKKLMERYGMDPSMFDEQLKAMGLDKFKTDTPDYESMRKTLSFQEKYKDKLELKNVTYYKINNDSNKVEILVEGKNVIVKSEGKVNLEDTELNEFFCSYKKLQKDEMINISIFENVKTYNY